MPLITILGMPGVSPKLVILTEYIKATIAAVPILGIDRNEVSVFYQPDLQLEGLGEELIAKIDGLFIKPERTDEVLSNLREAVTLCLEKFALRNLQQCTYVETFIASMVKPEDCSTHRVVRNKPVGGTRYEH